MDADTIMKFHDWVSIGLAVLSGIFMVLDDTKSMTFCGILSVITLMISED